MLIFVDKFVNIFYNLVHGVIRSFIAESLRDLGPNGDKGSKFATFGH